MIVDARTVIAVFLFGVSALVALAACGAALRAIFARAGRARAGRARDGGIRGGRARGRSAWDAHGPLLGLLLAVLAALQLVGVPLFYLVLQGYVPGLADRGVMCAYGVTRIQPELVRMTQVLGPLALYAAALWLAFASAAGEREAQGGAARPLHLALALCAGALGLAQSAAALAYFVAPKGVTEVTCCGAVTGAAAAALRLDPGTRDSNFGAPWVFWSAQLLLALALGLRGRAGTVWGVRGVRLGKFSDLALAALACGMAWISYAFWRDQLAPAVLGLPYHRCVYELLTETRGLGFAALCQAMALALATWPLLLRWAGDAGEAGARAARGSLVLALSGALIVAVHCL